VLMGVGPLGKGGKRNSFMARPPEKNYRGVPGGKARGLEVWGVGKNKVQKKLGYETGEAEKNRWGAGIIVLTSSRSFRDRTLLGRFRGTEKE